MTIDEALNRMIYLEEEALIGALQIHTPLEQPRPLSNADIEAIGVAIDRLKAKNGKQGEWRKETDNTRTWDRVRFYCSNCGDWQTYGETDYCSHCGARMKKKPDTKTPYNYGYWLKDKDNGFTCDDCGCWVVRPSAYCPDCGREMRVLHPEETE